MSVLDDIATAAIGGYLHLDATRIFFAYSVGDRDMGTARRKDPANEFTKSTRSSDHERGSAAEFSSCNPGPDTAHIGLSRRLGPRMRVDRTRPAGA